MSRKSNPGRLLTTTIVAAAIAAGVATLALTAAPVLAATPALAERTVQTHSTTVDGLKVFYREAGNRKAPVIVLLHGFPSSSHMYRDLIPLLADRYHVIAPDYIGFGYSAAPAATEYHYTFDKLAQSVQGLLDQLGVRDAVYYMQDYGGPVGMRLVTAHPERVKGLVIQNSNAYMVGVGQPLIDGFLPLWKERNAATEGAARGFLKAETTQFQYTHGARNPAALNPDAWTLDQALLDRPGNDAIQLDLFVDYQHNVALYDGWHAYFRQQQPKTLIFWGKGDPLFVVAGAQAYLQDLPKAKLVLLDGGQFALEEHAAHVATLIKKNFR